jgi:PAS domain S-box-containing protein
MQRIQRFFGIPPTDNPITEIQVKLLITVVLLLFAFSLVYLPMITFLLGISETFWLYVLALFFFGVMGYVVWLLKQQQSYRAGITFITVFWLMLTYVVMMTSDALLYPSIGYYLITIAAAGVMVDTRAVVVVGVASISVSVLRLLVIAQNAENIQSVEIAGAVILLFLFVLATLFFGLMTSQLRQVTERIQAQKQTLAQRNQDLEQALSREQIIKTEQSRFFEHTLDLIVIFELDGKIALVSPSVRQITGWAPADIIGKKLHDIIPPDEATWLETMRGQFYQQGYLRNVESRCPHKNGSHRLMSVNVWLVGDKVYALARDITELYAAAEQEKVLEMQAHQLELEQRFIQVLYHELRTPLTVMSTSTQLIEDDRLPAAKRSEHIQRLTRQVGRMQNLIDETLQLRRLTDPAYKLHPQPLQVRELLPRVIDAVGGMATNQPVHLMIAPEVPPIIRADADVLEYTVSNLLTNALKYSDEAVYVRVGYTSTTKTCYLEVEDHGIGIDSRDMAHIFDPFYRGGNARAYNGSGIGLSIVRDGVRKHGGEIACDSQLGRGTIVRITLPELDSVPITTARG